jgi:hypothetical protein
VVGLAGVEQLADLREVEHGGLCLGRRGWWEHDRDGGWGHAAFVLLWGMFPRARVDLPLSPTLPREGGGSPLLMCGAIYGSHAMLVISMR